MEIQEKIRLITKSKKQYLISLIFGNFLQIVFIFLIFFQLLANEENNITVYLITIAVLLPIGFFIGYQPYKAYIQMKQMIREYVKEDSIVIFTLISGERISFNITDVVEEKNTSTYVIDKKEIPLVSFFIKSQKIYYHYWVV